MRQLRAAGVPILAGSDAPNPGTAHGASMHRELELLVDSGLTPVEALRSATLVPARAFGLTDRGRVATGLRGDLVLVNGDPTTDILATRDIAGVWKRGVMIDRAGYLAELAKARADVAAGTMFARSKGQMPVIQRFTTSADWKEVVLPIASFQGIDARDLMGIAFVASGTPGGFRLAIDEVRLR